MKPTSQRIIASSAGKIVGGPPSDALQSGSSGAHSRSTFWSRSASETDVWDGGVESVSRTAE
jgi:hypothetical protein